MRAANTRPMLALAVTLAGILGAFGTSGCFSGRSLTDPSSGNPGTGFRPPTSQIAAVALSPSSISGKPGDSTQITATLKDSSGAVVVDSAVAWSSTDSSVATVSANGRVRLWHKGRSWISIKVGGLTDSVPTTVSPQVLATIQLSPASISGATGSTTQITAVLKDSTGAVMTTPPTLSWTSSSSSVASVSSSGLVTLSKAGTATITASASGVSATVGVTAATPPPGPVTSITLSPSAITGVPGNTTQISATLKDANGNVVTGVVLAWSTSNTGVATVSSNGVVTLVKQGAATITASTGSVTATIGATVNAAPVASISLSPASVSGVPGNTTQVSAVPKDASGNAVTGQSVSWASADATIANVSSAGLVTLKKQGSTTVTASDGSITATVTVTVNAAPLASIALSPTSLTGVAGNSAQLSAVPEDASGNTVSGVTLGWSSSNTAVATVSGGTVTFVKQGTATITVSGSGVSATAGVTVTAPAPPTVSAVVVTPTSVNMTVGQSTQLTASAVDASGNPMSGATISWSSSNTGMATVSGTGMVRAVVAGAVIMTATSGGHTATANVQVTAAPSSGGGAGGTNEPSGMSTQFNTGAITSFAGSQLTMIGGAQPTPAPGSGLRVTYSPSLAGGNSPGQLGTGDFANAGTGTLYVRYNSRTSVGFTTNGNTDIKNFEPHTFQEGASSGEENHILALWAVGSSSQLSPLIGLQGPYTASNIHPNPAVIVSDGNWHTIEWLLVQDSPAGAGNGTAQVWVDGTQVINTNTVTWLGSGNQRGWKALVCDPTYGGGTASPPTTMYWDFDQLYVSTK